MIFGSIRDTMDFPDNNVLINALRADAPHHAKAKSWLEHCLNSGQPIRLFPTVKRGFPRVVTHSGIFTPSTPIGEASRFLTVLSAAPSVEVCHWNESSRLIWLKLCEEMNLSGNDCNDALLAAVCIDRSLRLVSFDRGFKRFGNLRLLLLD